MTIIVTQGLVTHHYVKDGNVYRLIATVITNQNIDTNQTTMF